MSNFDIKRFKNSLNTFRGSSKVRCTDEFGSRFIRQTGFIHISFGFVNWILINAHCVIYVPFVRSLVLFCHVVFWFQKIFRVIVCLEYTLHFSYFLLPRFLTADVSCSFKQGTNYTSLLIFRVVARVIKVPVRGGRFPIYAEFQLTRLFSIYQYI